MIKVGFDVTALIYGRGVSRYTSNLVRALLQFRPDLELKLFGYNRGQLPELRRQVAELHTPGGRRFKVKYQPLPIDLQALLWRLNLNPVSKQLSPLDVFHSWDWLQPPDKEIPLVSTIHDLAILKYPEAVKPEVMKAHQRSWKILKERQAEIIAVSEATRQDVINLLGFSPEKVHLVYEALPIENTLTAQEMTEENFTTTQAELGLDEQHSKPFLLFVGNREPRKNLHRLIEAWAPLASYVDLLIAGLADGDDTENLAQQFAGSLRFLGRVTDQELAVLYTLAEAFVYPSLDEGFGLPILESFYYGTPVITSNLSAMKEIAGDAAILIDPLDLNSIYNGIVSLLNESPAQQHQRAQKMILQQQHFSWEKAALQTATVYELATQR